MRLLPLPLCTLFLLVRAGPGVDGRRREGTCLSLSSRLLHPPEEAQDRRGRPISPTPMSRCSSPSSAYGVTSPCDEPELAGRPGRRGGRPYGVADRVQFTLPSKRPCAAGMVNVARHGMDPRGNGAMPSRRLRTWSTYDEFDLGMRPTATACSTASIWRWCTCPTRW